MAGRPARKHGWMWDTRFRAFRAAWFLRRHATALMLIHFLPLLSLRFRDSARSVRGQTSRVRWDRCPERFTGEEDMITSVNYFVVGDTREKTQIRFGGSTSMKNSPACFADQRERNEIIAEWDENPKCLRRCNFASPLINANFRLHRDGRIKCNCSLCQSTISARGGWQMGSLVRSERDANMSKAQKYIL